MNTTSLHNDTAQVVEFVNKHLLEGRRTIIGIAGPPASGKSTLAEAVVEKLNQEGNALIPRATLLPMDGFHLDNSILESRGILNKKGAPETFNAHGFCEAIKKLEKTQEKIYLPKFDRVLDLAIANAIVIHPDTSIVVVEGNYLLLKNKPWSTLRDVFTKTVFISPSLDALRQRLYQRWIDHGLEADAAMSRATSNDLVNAELVLQQSNDADLILMQN